MTWILNGDLDHLIEDGAQVVLANGKKFPGSFPKGSIPGMAQVVEPPAPDTVLNKISGSTIEMVNGTPTRVHAATPYTLAELKAQKRTALAAHRAAVAGSGTVIGGNVFKTDDGSANEIDTAIRQIERGLLTPPVKFTSQTSGNFQADQAALQAILNGIVAHRQAARAAEYAHAAAIAALATEAAVAAYDFTVNIVGSEWPTPPV